MCKASYAGGLTSKWRTILIRLHIAKCRACRRELELLFDADRNLTAALQEPVPSPDISRRVMPLLKTPPAAVAMRSRNPLHARLSRCGSHVLLSPWLVNGDSNRKKSESHNRSRSGKSPSVLTRVLPYPRQLHYSFALCR